MGLKRRKLTKEFKLQVIAEVEAGKPMSQVAREHQVNATTIAKWRKQLRQYKDKAFVGNGHADTDEARTAELERMLGRLTMENDLLKKALHKLGA
jgi:transposase